jgi:hypothetical protein
MSNNSKSRRFPNLEPENYEYYKDADKHYVETHEFGLQEYDTEELAVKFINNYGLWLAAMDPYDGHG